MYIPVKYGTAVDLYIPLITVNAQDFIGSITLAPEDSTISKDGGAEANLATVTAETAAGEMRFKVSLSAAETTCKIGSINIIDAAPKVFEDQNITFYTYGNASAFMSFDFSSTITDALTVDQYVESSSVPAATSSLKDKISWLCTLARNKITQTSTTQTVKNDSESADIATASVSDDGSTATRDKWTS